jgi:hypothetical protein
LDFDKDQVEPFIGHPTINLESTDKTFLYIFEIGIEVFSGFIFKEINII